MTTISRILTAVFLTAVLHAVHATERWETLPSTPAPVANERVGRADVNGIRLFFAVVGHGSPVLVLHGGLANSDYMGHQVKALMANHMVVLVDSRGHGRSTRDARPYGYDLMADDVVALMDKLRIKKADVVGWSDGAIIGLYKEISPTPQDYDRFVEQISRMWSTQPEWSDAQLKTIRSPVLVMDGDHDEGIKREHTEYIAATIPGATLKILPNASHFAFLQDPADFNAAMLHFLGDN